MTTATIPTDHEWLPDIRSCPSWCDKQHAEALAEGNGWERSQLHHSGADGATLSALSYAGRHIRGWGGGWDLTLEQQPLGPDGGYLGPALIAADFSSLDPDSRDVTLNITSGEARTLAAQLIAAADRLDLR